MKHVKWIVALLVALPLICWAAENETDTFTLDEIVVTATKTETEVKTLPTNVMIITEEEIQRVKPTDLFDLLRHVPGLNIGQASSRSAYMAGFRGIQPTGKGINLMLDGFEVNNVANWMAPLNIIPYNIERIEIVKSPASSLYGVNGAGGVINVITRKPVEAFEGSASLTLGSFDRKELQANAGGLLENGFFYGVNAWWLDSDGFRDNQYNENFVINPRLGLAGESFGLEIMVNIKDIDDGYPGGLLLDEYKDDPKKASQPSEYGNGHAEPRLYGAKFYFEPGNHSRIDVKASYSTLSTWMENGGTYSEVDDSDNWVAEASYRYDFSVGNMKNSLLAGAEYRDLAFHIDLRPDDNHPQVWKMSSDIDEEIWGFFIQDEIRPTDKLTVLAGARYDKIITDYEHAFAVNSYEKTHRKWSPRLGFSYDLDPRANIFANYSQGIRSVSLTQFPPALRENLDPEKLESIEMGIRGNLSDFLSYNLAVFQVFTKDIIIGTGGIYDFENAGEARSRGMELGVKFRLPLGFYAAFDYTYLDSEFTDYKTATTDFDGNRVPLVPRYTLGSSFGWMREPYGKIDVSVRYVDDKFIDAKNELELDAYVVVDAMYTYQYSDFDFRLAVNNLFDETYAEFGVASGGSYIPVPVAFPAEGRSIVGTLSYSF